MSFTKHCQAAAVLFCIGIAGCTPANFIQRVQSAPSCDVRICTNIGASAAQCDCKSHQQLQRQMREAWGQKVE